MERDIYGQGFRRARTDAALRLARPDLMEMDSAAAAIGISASMLQQLETGKKRPGFDTLEAIARAYNVLPGDLLPSLAPKGPEVDRILGPLMALAPNTRSRFLVQLEAFARMIAAEINAAVQVAIENNVLAPEVVPSYNPSPPHSAPADVLRDIGTPAGPKVIDEPRRRRYVAKERSAGAAGTTSKKR